MAFSWRKRPCGQGNAEEDVGDVARPRFAKRVLSPQPIEVLGANVSLEAVEAEDICPVVDSR